MGGAIITSDEGLLLVENLRRNGSSDWTTPGGVIDEGESLLDGLTREVEEETGLRVTRWRGPVYEVAAEAPDMGWRLRVEVHEAVEYEGHLRVDDPDGIVVDARFIPLDDCHDSLHGCPPWVRVPLAAWLEERWDDDGRLYRYRLEGAERASMVITRLDA